MPESLRYQSLHSETSIRLLEITSGDEIICCSLTETVGDWPPYFALSYTWGSPDLETAPNTTTSIPEKLFPILCNGQHLEITENAYQALRQLQKRDPTLEGPMHGLKYCWIDAICINQADLLERNSQVAMMGTIYARATAVLVWLGEARTDSSQAMKLVWDFGTALQKEFKDPNDFPADFPAIEFNDIRVYEDLGLKLITPSQWHSILRLLTKRWFTRGWVMQEVILAKKLVVLYDGQYHDSDPLILFTCFLLASGWVAGVTSIQGYSEQQKHPESIGLRQLGAAIFYRAFQAEGPEHPDCRRILANIYQADTQQERLYAYLQHLTLHTRPRQVGDQKDKVFAPLALTTHFIPDALKNEPVFEWIKPDYTISVEDAYTNFTAFLIRNSKFLHLLSAVIDRSVRKIQNLPSWVPDFSVVGTSPLSILGLNATRHWNIFQHNSTFLSPQTLEVFGYLPDEVVSVAPSIEDVLAQHNVTSWFTLLLELGNLGNAHESKQSPIERLWRTLIANVDTEPFSAGAVSDLAKSFRSFILLELSVAFMESQRKQVEPSTFWKDNESLTTMSAAYPHELPSIEDVVEMATLFSTNTYTETPTWPAKIAPLTEYRNLLSIVSTQRRVVITRRGCLVLAPLSTQADDVVAFVQGAYNPFVLRRLTTENHGRFELIGEVYVHEFMNGEIAQWGTPVFEEVILV